MTDEEYLIILNINKDKVTKEQKEEGAIDLPEQLRTLLIRELEYIDIPTCNVINGKACRIYDIVVTYLTSTVSPLPESLKVKLLKNETIKQDVKIGFYLDGDPWMIDKLKEHLNELGDILYSFKYKGKHIGFFPIC